MGLPAATPLRQDMFGLEAAYRVYENVIRFVYMTILHLQWSPCYIGFPSLLGRSENCSVRVILASRFDRRHQPDANP